MVKEAELGKDLLPNIFPGLKHDCYFRIMSPQTTKYNCIAWAMGYNDRWVDINTNMFGHWWPSKIPKGTDPESLIAAFKAVGFEKCSSGLREPGFDKVALYQMNNEWTHAARIITDEVYHSKMGQLWDIYHSSGDLFKDSPYGNIFCYMKRRHRPFLSNWFPGRKRDD